MTNILTKSDIQFDEIRILRETIFNIDAGQEEIKWYVNVGYKVQTQEGEEYNRNKQVELKGTRLDKAKAFFIDLVNLIKTEEGII